MRYNETVDEFSVGGRQIHSRPELEPDVAATAPSGPTLTDYDHRHHITYMRLLDAHAENAPGQDVARIVLRLDPARNPDAAKRTYESHLARAQWMTHTGYREGMPTDTIRAARKFASRYDLSLLEGDTVTVAGVRFVGATLWSDYALAGEHAEPDKPTGERIYAKTGGPLLNIAGSAALHRKARKRLATLINGPTDRREGEEAYNSNDTPLVVVTHHAPHPDCVPPPYRGTWGAGNVASSLPT